MIGSTYVNKHNGKTIEIEEKLVTDTGTILYYGVNTANGHGEYYSTKNLEEHWVGNAEKRTIDMPSMTIIERNKYNDDFLQWMVERDVDIVRVFHEQWVAENEEV
jgi:hypothetical protein